MKVLVNGQLIEYKKEGQGNAVLLLHGWGTSLASFDQLSQHLVVTGHEVFRIDFPGFGASPVPNGNWSVGEYAELTAAFVGKMNISKLTAIFGHSFGGRVIIKGVATGLLQPEKVILMGSAGIKPKTTAKMIAYRTVAKTGKAVTALPGLNKMSKSLRERLYAAVGSSDYQQSGAMKQVFLNTIREDLTQYLPAIAAPTLLLWGERDTETPLADGKLMHAKISKSELIVLPNAGHFVYDDDFDGATKAIDRFLG
ncbi:MAG: alpha/beta hydrolase family protein [Candidatus Saccharibacteria bacterium]|nr:alpha/beta hydrolase family protein [Candidatus Saccharibacteria bacterium]